MNQMHPAQMSADNTITAMAKRTIRFLEVVQRLT